MTTTHPLRPADEGEKCKTCGGTGMVADGCYPDGDVIYWPCHSCSPRPEAGKEGKIEPTPLIIKDGIASGGQYVPAPDADARGERFNSDGYPSTLTAEERAIVTARVAERTDRENLAACVVMDFVALAYRERNALIDEAVREVEDRRRIVQSGAKDERDPVVDYCFNEAIAALNSLRQRP